MFKYKVIGKGTYNGRFYSPHEAKPERRMLEVEKKFDPVPPWLEPVKNTTKAPPRVDKVSTVSAAATPVASADFSGGKQEVL